MLSAQTHNLKIVQPVNKNTAVRIVETFPNLGSQEEGTVHAYLSLCHKISLESTEQNLPLAWLQPIHH
jgi:hypothetical protein